jgi:hypothetical protein
MRMLACKRAREWGKNPSGNVDAVDIRVSARADSALSAAQNMFLMHIWYAWYACDMHERCMRCVCRAFRSMRTQWPPPMRGDTDPRLCTDLARVKNMLFLTHILISMQSFTAYKKSLRPLSQAAGQWLTGPPPVSYCPADWAKHERILFSQCFDSVSTAHVTWYRPEVRHVIKLHDVVITTHLSSYVVLHRLYMTASYVVIVPTMCSVSCTESDARNTIRYPNCVRSERFFFV